MPDREYRERMGWAVERYGICAGFLATLEAMHWDNLQDYINAYEDRIDVVRELWWSQKQALVQRENEE